MKPEGTTFCDVVEFVLACAWKLDFFHGLKGQYNGGLIGPVTRSNVNILTYPQIPANLISTPSTAIYV